MKILTFLAATFFTLFTIWIFGWVWFATTVAMAERNTKIEKTDAIIVVTGGNGRINEGLDLLDDKKAPKLFISGVNENTTKNDIYKVWDRPDNKRKHSKPCCIYLGYAAKDTNGNAVEVRNWVKENKIDTIRFVTSTYHMPRAYYVISTLLPDRDIILHPVFSDDFKAWKGRFWTLTFSEYNKLLASFMMPKTFTQDS